MADTAPATLTSLTLTDAVDAVSSPLMTIEVGASDPDGIQYVEFWFTQPLLTATGPEGYRTSTSLWANSAWAGGTRSVSFGVDKINEPGIRALRSIKIFDKLDNVTEFSAAQLRALGVDTQFTLSGTTPDREAPVIHSFNLPAFIDTSKGPAPWTISASVTDNLLPRDSMVQVEFERPLKQAWHTSDLIKPPISAYFENTAFGFGGSELASGRAFETTWIAAPNGIYNIARIYTSDLAGNMTVLDPASLRQMGITTQVLVSDGNYVAPTLDPRISTLPHTADGAGAIVLNLAAGMLRPGSNEVDVTISYDARVARFAGSDGNLNALKIETLEVGAAGSIRITGTVDTSGTPNGFPALRFSPLKDAGQFALDLSEIRINGEALLNRLDQSFDYRIQTAQRGGEGGDTLAGTPGDDLLQGLEGNDLFKASAGVDTLDGGQGHDTVRYTGMRADYTLARVQQDVMVTKPADAAGMDRLQSVETLVFADQNVDFGQHGMAAQIFRLYKAAFDRVPEASGLGFWLAAAGNGLTLQQIAGGFVASKEFIALHARNPDHAAIVNSFYLNTLDRAADAEGTRFWNDLLERKVLDVAQVLTGFSESPEHQAIMAELIGQGMSYTA